MFSKDEQNERIDFRKNWVLGSFSMIVHLGVYTQWRSDGLSCVITWLNDEVQSPTLKRITKTERWLKEISII